MFYNIQNYYGFYFGYEYQWNERNEIEYQEGTLVVDLVDTEASRLIWQGAAVGVLHDDRPDERVAERIRESVGLMFKKFPGKRS